VLCGCILRQSDAVLVPPLAPDFNALPVEIRHDLDARFSRIPFDRVGRYADYWALRAIEEHHVRKLAHRHHLSEEDRRSLGAWWLARIAGELHETLARLGSERRDRTTRLIRRRTRPPRSKVLAQISHNTIGPGGRCWLGNRYTTVRHYTFMVHWRA
jgi:hypothetical protein